MIERELTHYHGANVVELGGRLRCTSHAGRHGENCPLGCVHIMDVVKEQLDAWVPNLGADEIPGTLLVPMFCEVGNAYDGLFVEVAVDEPDDAGYHRFRVDLSSCQSSDFAYDVPWCTGYVTYGDGRVGIRQQIMPWLIEIGDSPHRKCESSLHQEDYFKKEHLGQTNRLYLIDTLSILFEAKCQACLTLEKQIIPSI